MSWLVALNVFESQHCVQAPALWHPRPSGRRCNITTTKNKDPPNHLQHQQEQTDEQPTDSLVQILHKDPG